MRDVNKLKKREGQVVPEAPVDPEVHYVERDDIEPGLSCWWQKTKEKKDEATHVVLSRRYFEGWQRMFGEFGINQMKAAVDIVVAAIVYVDNCESFSVLEEAVQRYNKYVTKRSK